MTTKTYEVERKWLLANIPSACDNIEPIRITQAYLSGIRIRRANSKTYITVKSTGNLARLEWEKPIPRWVFEQLIVESKCVITKKRYVIRKNLPALTIDVFEGQLSGLVLLEAEWIAETTPDDAVNLALSYELPSIFTSATEVTHDQRFHNYCLAQNQTIPSSKDYPY